MVIDMSLPPSSGSTSIKANLGSQDSHGFEFSVWGKIIRTKDWEWNLSANGLYSRSTIKNISEALKRRNEMNASSNISSSPLQQYREGESPSAIYAVRSAGIDPASVRRYTSRRTAHIHSSMTARTWCHAVIPILTFRAVSLHS